MAEKFIEWDATNGRYKQNEGLVTSVGAGDAGKIIALDGAGKLDVSVLPSGIGAATVTVPSSENLAAGDFVNLYNNGGTMNARKADANANRRAHGFVLANVTSPANATVYYGDVNNQLTGLTVGSEYFLSETAGGVVTPAPTTSGSIVQRLGVAQSATELVVDIEETPLELA
jgi:hypothetical protein